jgi:hypothetical protein
MVPVTRVPSGVLVRIGLPSYLLSEFRKSGVSFVRLLRARGDGLKLNRVTIEDISGLTFRVLSDEAFYQPYAPIEVPACGDAQIRPPALWVPETAGAESAVTFAPGALSQLSGNDARLIYRVINVGLVRWVAQRRKGKSISICRAGDDYEITMRSGSGALEPPALDAVFREGTAFSPRTRPDGSIRLNAGDVIYDSGRMYEIVPAKLPQPLYLLVSSLIPLLFAATAIPLAIVIGVRQAALWKDIVRSEKFVEGRIASGLVVFSPYAALPLIIGMMTLGAMFHVKLAATGELVGHPGYLKTFLFSCVIAIAGATGLAVLADGGRKARALSCAFLSLSFAAVVVGWIEPVALIAGGQKALAGTGSWKLLLAPALLFVLAVAMELGVRIRWRQMAFQTIPIAIRIRESVSQAEVLTRAWIMRIGGSNARLRESYLQKYEDFQRPGRREISIALHHFVWLLWPGVAAVIIGGILTVPAVSLRNAGKEIVPPLIVLAAAWVGGRLTHFVLSSGGSKPLAVDLPVGRAGLLFIFALIMLVPLIFARVVNYPRIVILCVGVIGALMILLSVRKAFSLWARWLWHLLPFFFMLLASAIAFRDFGAILVWTWALTLLGAWCIILTVHLKDHPRGTVHFLGAGLASLTLAVLPPTILGVFNYLRSWLNLDNYGLERAVERFQLADNPFYYNAGEWLARVQVMATRQKPTHWIANLSSDVALNGFWSLSPDGSAIFCIFLSLLLVVLLAAFLGMFRAAALPLSKAGVAGRLQSAFFAGTAFFGLLMLLLVHIGASVFDSLPLTGVPCPWLSHSNATHIVMTSLVIFTTMSCSQRLRSGNHDK